MGITLSDCYSTAQFRRLAKARLPGPIFHYIDGAADDEVTYRRNTEAYEACDLVPNVLAGVENIDLSTTVMGIPMDMPLFLSPTALQRLFHHDGERAVGRAAEAFNTALWHFFSSHSGDRGNWRDNPHSQDLSALLPQRQGAHLGHDRSVS